MIALLGFAGVVVAIIALWPRQTEADLPPESTGTPPPDPVIWDEWGSTIPDQTPVQTDDRPWYSAIWDAIMPTPGPLTGSRLSSDETRTILLIANEIGIDARLLAAIRQAEMGGPGKEFGVTSINAPTYEDQARAAAITIRNNQQRYEEQYNISATGSDGRFTPRFLGYLASKYAPINAANDPLGLNANWLTNVASGYAKINYA